MNATTPKAKTRRIVRDESIAASLAGELVNCGYWFACRLLGESGDQYEFAVAREHGDQLSQMIATARHRAGK